MTFRKNSPRRHALDHGDVESLLPSLYMPRMMKKPLRESSLIPCLISCVLLLYASSFSAFSPPAKLAPSRVAPRTTVLLNVKEEEVTEDNTELNDGLGSLLSGARKVMKKGGSGVKSIASATVSTAFTAASTAGSGAKIVVGTASSGISKLAEKGSSDVVSAVNVVGSGVNAAASQAIGTAGSGAKSVANAVVSGASQVVDVAGSGFKSISGVAVSSASQVVGVAGSGAKVVAVAATSSVSQLVEKGGSDVSTVIQWLDAQGRVAVNATRDTTYAANVQAKAVAKELIRLAKSSDLSISDILLLLKVLIVLGASFGPLAKILPVTVLLNMLNVSLEARVGGKILEVLAGTLDERFTAAFTAEELGDLAKRSLKGAITAFTGKESYETGDIERTVKKEIADNDKTSSRPLQNRPLELTIGPEFSQWDEEFRRSSPEVEFVIVQSLNERRGEAGIMQSRAANELEEWDRKFRAMETQSSV